MRTPRANRYRERWCGELRASDAGTTVRVAGWVHRRRDHGGLIFIDLRDRTGLVQLVFHPDSAPQAHAAAHELRSEAVLSVSGPVVLRAPATVNPGLATGEVELAVSELDVLATSPTPPFPIEEDVSVDEALRLRHRPLDLRREPMRDALVLRHRVVRTMRETLERHDFLEIETPILTRATPEGARQDRRLDLEEVMALERLPHGAHDAVAEHKRVAHRLAAQVERAVAKPQCLVDADV